MRESVLQNANRCKDKAFLQLSHCLGFFFHDTKKEAEASFIIQECHLPQANLIEVSRKACLSPTARLPLLGAALPVRRLCNQQPLSRHIALRLRR